MFEVGGFYCVTFRGFPDQMECIRATHNSFIMRRAFDGALVEMGEDGNIVGYKYVDQEWVYIKDNRRDNWGVSQSSRHVYGERSPREEAYRQDEEEEEARRRRRNDELESWEVGYH